MLEPYYLIFYMKLTLVCLVFFFYRKVWFVLIHPIMCLIYPINLGLYSIKKILKFKSKISA